MNLYLKPVNYNNLTKNHVSWYDGNESIVKTSYSPEGGRAACMLEGKLKSERTCQIEDVIWNS